jgi:hypothetical protein
LFGGGFGGRRGEKCGAVSWVRKHADESVFATKGRRDQNSLLSPPAAPCPAAPAAARRPCAAACSQTWGRAGGPVGFTGASATVDQPPFKAPALSPPLSSLQFDPPPPKNTHPATTTTSPPLTARCRRRGRTPRQGPARSPCTSWPPPRCAQRPCPCRRRQRRRRTWRA